MPAVDFGRKKRLILNGVGIVCMERVSRHFDNMDYLRS
jgi:hypothetical protein